MAKLINGNGNPAIYAAEDADLIASLAGNVTCIANVGNKYAATEEDATTIRLDDGVIITKEGRRIQLEAGESDTFYIPTGTSGQTNYYIIGYKLVQNADSTQVAEQFVQKMNSSSETITEDTFRSGATEVYVSVYRVTQVGFTIDSISGLLPELLDNASIKDNIDQINSDRINGDTAMSQRVAKFENRRVILVGDSYLYGMYVDTNPYSRITSFGTYLKTYLGIADADFFMVDIDGGGFVTNGAAERQWLPQLQARASSISNHDTISDIYVVGGQNDVSKTGVSAAIASFATYCKSEYPNARLHIGFCGVDYINRDLQEAHIAAIKTYIEAGLENGMNYIQGIEYVLRNTTLLQSDHCHPEEAGQKALARFLVNYVNKNMNDGGLVTYGMEKPSFTAATGVSGTFSANVMKAGTNTDVWFFFAQGFSLASSSGVNWDGTHEIELGELSDSALWGFGYTGADSENYSNMEAPASFVIGGTVYGGHLNLHVRAKHVFCSPMIFTNSGNYMSGSITVIIPPQVAHTSVNSLLI